MKLYIIRFILVSLVPLFLYQACDELRYTPTGSNYHDLELPDIRKVELSLDSVQDTLTLWGINDFTINTNKHIYQVEVYLDSTKLLQTNSDRFTIETEDFTDGVYALRIKAIVATESPSLASQLHAETFQVEHTNYIEIYNRPPDPVSITSIRPENGLLKMAWSEYKGPQFTEYQIYETIVYNTWSEEVMVKSITDQNQQSWSSPDFIAGTRRYRVRLIAKSQSNFGPDTTISYPYNTMTLSLNSENLAEISWQKPIFYRAIQYYKIQKEVGNPTFPDWKTISSIYNYKDTCYVDQEFGFGNTAKYRIQYIPNGFGAYLTDPDTISIGESSWEFEKLYHNQDADLMYLFTERITVLHARTFQLVYTRSGTWINNFTISLDYSKAFMKLDQYRFAEVDPVSLINLKTYNLPDYTGYESIVGEIACNNDGMVYISSMTYKSPTVYSDKYYVINPEDTTPVAVVGEGHPKPWPLLLDNFTNGPFQLMRWQETGIHKFENGTLKLTAPIQDKTFFCFNPKRSSYFYSSGNSISEYDLETNAVLNTINTDFTLRNIQLVNGYKSIAGYSLDGFFQVYDLQSGQLQKQVKLMLPVKGSFYLVNDYLLSTIGFRIRVD